MNDTTEAKIRAVLDAGSLTGHDIVYLLSLRGYAQTRLAIEMSVTRPTINDVIHGWSSSTPIASRIAEIIGTTPGHLWPGRYPIPPRPAAGRATPKRKAA